jgi:hypothetical protein
VVFDVHSAVVDKAMAGFVELAGCAFAANRDAYVADELAHRCAGLAELVGATGAGAGPRGGAGAELADLRKWARAVARHAERAAAPAAAAVGALAEAAVVQPRAPMRATARRSTTRVYTAVERTAKALELARRDARIAGRIAAGFAAVQGPVRGYEPLCEAVLGLLLAVPIESDQAETVVVTLAGGDADRRAIARLVGHVRLSAPAVLVAEADDDRGRYVELVVADRPRPSVVVESVGDGELEPSATINDAQRRALGERRFLPPDDDHVSWRRDGEGSSAIELADLLLETLAEVHGAGPGADVKVTVAGVTALDAESAHEVPDDPPALDLEEPTVPALAGALATRLRESIDVVGVDRIWASVSQPGSPYFANLGSNMDGGLFTEVTGNFYLDEEDHLDGEQIAQVQALGWDDPLDDPSDDEDLQPRNHTRIWPVPLDLDTACWHVAVTLVTVYGFDLEEPVLVEVGLF